MTIALLTYAAGVVAIAAADLGDPCPGNRLADTATLAALWPIWMALAIVAVVSSFMGGAPGDDEVEW